MATIQQLADSLKESLAILSIPSLLCPRCKKMQVDEASILCLAETGLCPSCDHCEHE